MIISKTPFRISFFGGGTDYPVWFKENGGSVLATTINKYCYLSCRFLPPFFEHKHRIVYSKVECVKSNDEIQHPSVRAVLEYLKLENGLEIHHDGDLPARAGLGTSSAFTVGLLHALYALKGKMPQKKQLAKDAIHLEQNVLKEYVGCQDQILAATGGFNQIEFLKENDFLITPITISKERLLDLQSHLLLFFTGLSRTASEMAKTQIEKIPQNEKHLFAMKEMVYEAINVLNSGQDIKEFGKLLHESWMLKRSLCENITNTEIDKIYSTARENGAIGGKLLGAGGGGFFLIFARPEDQPKIIDKLNHLIRVPFEFEDTGSQIIIYQPDYL